MSGSIDRYVINKKVITLTALGFSAGVPLLLIFSTLSVWLNEAGVEKSAVTYFSWAALGYSFKFIWAPIVDKLPLPILTAAFGRRRGWLLLSQCAVIGAILLMGSIDPALGLSSMALAAVALGFSSATQDIVVDSYRIECAEVKVQAILSSAYIAGYRIGMVVGGAGGLYIAGYIGSTPENYLYSAWQTAYWVMAASMLIGVATTLVIREPKALAEQNSPQLIYPYATLDYLRFFGLFILCVIVFIGSYRIFPVNILANTFGDNPVITFLATAIRISFAAVISIATGFGCAKLGVTNREMLRESYLYPIKDFFLRYQKVALWILLLIGFYRVSDIVMGIVANIFYQDMGYSKTEIASVTKVFGVLMTIAGAFIGGFLALRIGVLKTLLLGAILAAVSNLAFAWMSVQSEPGITSLAFIITIDNLSAGVATSAFVAWLSSLTSISFTATQYAIFSSLMTLFPKVLGGYSGSMVESMGYTNFFILTALIGIPVLLLILFLKKLLPDYQAKN